MSGICALWQKDGAGLTPRALAVVAGGLVLEKSETLYQCLDEAAGVAVSSRFPGQQLYGNEQTLVCCDADLLNQADLEQLVGTAPTGKNATAALLAALYERFGREVVAKLRGTFSLVLLDRRREEVTAAVDHFGVKRLVYAETPAGILIASRIEALMNSGEIPREISPRAIADLVNFSVVPGPGTAFRAIHRIPPGSVLVAGNGTLRISQYWDMRYGTGSSRNVRELAREMESLVEVAVAKNCQRSSDHVGAFLSGGTDSSTVVGMMSRLRPGSVNAFSIGFDERSFNELVFARIAAKAFGARHHTSLVSARDCCEALPRMVRYFDQPFGNSSAIPTYFCARLAAAEGIEVLLGGDGGDELFGGNEAYRSDMIFQYYHRLPVALRNSVVQPMLAMLPFRNGWTGKARNYVRRANMPPVERILSYHFLRTHPMEAVFEPAFLETLRDYSVFSAIDQHYSFAPASDALDRRLYTDVKTVLGDSDLPKVTCMSELAGIQAQFPFLDVDVAEFSGRIPADFKVNGLEKRYLFRRAFRELLPPEILAKKKHGFGIPVALWMKSDRGMRELTQDTLRSQRARERGYFRRAFMDQLFLHHETDQTTYYGDALWVFLTLELWHRQFFDTVTAGAA